ncbi:hypothetical protein TrLO_g9509 [Triparma laevis f. longispina]|uniref:Sulfatase N-terminal domain-containing protein n=1 Tax=Triparma laevis f. longispina TaxID=1714387 RepID=A0A9W7C8I2_9STRA|nr:hypothetical protein TrLO_g9509 [Triparma laevis f. longispina]
MASSLRLFLTIVVTLLLLPPTIASSPPHVIYILLDDLGFSDLGYTTTSTSIPTPSTPTIDSLQSSPHTRTLKNYYIEPVCSPSRSSIQTGLYPLHHGVVNWLKPEDPNGLPLNLTTMAEHMNELGYVSRAVGKWHMGFYRDEYTPTFRGYSSFTGFYGGGEDYFTHVEGDGYDFRSDTKPHCGTFNSCSKVLTNNSALNRYSTEVFGEAAVNIINNHADEDPDKPLFLYLAFQGVHSGGGTTPQKYLDLNKNLTNPRLNFAGMLTAVDSAIKNVTESLKDNGLFDNTIIVFSTDNGGPVDGGDAVGSTNWPLRGGKHTIWEGGIRGVGFVTGGEDTVLNNSNNNDGDGDYNHLMNGVDWLPTIVGFGGGSAENIEGIDGVSHYEALINSPSSTTPRDSFYIGHYDANNDDSFVGGRGVRWDDVENDRRWKMIEQIKEGKNVPSWYSSENCAQSDDATSTKPCCGPKNGCEETNPSGTFLFDVLADPSESQDLSNQFPDIVTKLRAMADDFEEGQIEEGPPLEVECGDAVMGMDDVANATWQPWCSLLS